jgi:hypothetical protein
MLDEVAADPEQHIGVDAAGTNGNAKRRANRQREEKRPVWERLNLRRSADGSDHTAVLDDERLPIQGEAAFKMLKPLQEKKGDRVKGTLLQTEIGQPPNRVYALLQRPLQLIIDKPGQGGAGYAMRENPRPVPTPEWKASKRRKTTASTRTSRKARKPQRRR